jgi:hypothetical protein
MRFYTGMRILAEQLTAEGVVVLMPFVAVPPGSQAHARKEMLDRLHRQKIDAASSVYIVTDDSRYAGASTQAEIEYARAAGKQVIWWTWRGGAWLRLAPGARDGRVTVLSSVEVHCGLSSVNRKLAAVTSFYEFHARHGVDVARLLVGVQPAGRRRGAGSFADDEGLGTGRIAQLVRIMERHRLIVTLVPFAGEATGTRRGHPHPRDPGRAPCRSPDLPARALGARRHRRRMLARQMYEELGEDGKRRYTVAQIAAEFGVARPTIYRHLSKTG